MTECKTTTWSVKAKGPNHELKIHHISSSGVFALVSELSKM